MYIRHFPAAPFLILEITCACNEITEPTELLLGSEEFASTESLQHVFNSSELMLTRVRWNDCLQLFSHLFTGSTQVKLKFARWFRVPTRDLVRIDSAYQLIQRIQSLMIMAFVVQWNIDRVSKTPNSVNDCACLPVTLPHVPHSHRKHSVESN